MLTHDRAITWMSHSSFLRQPHERPRAATSGLQDAATPESCLAASICMGISLLHVEHRQGWTAHSRPLALRLRPETEVKFWRCTHRSPMPAPCVWNMWY